MISRSLKTFFFGSILLAGKSFAQDSVSISDFRYPETKAVDLKGNLTSSLFANNSDRTVPAGILPTATENATGGNGFFSLGETFLFFHTKDDHDQSFSLTSLGMVRYSNLDDNRVDTSFSRNQSDRQSLNASVLAHWTYQHYITQDGIHFIGDVSADYNTSHDRSNELSQAGSSSSSYESVTNQYSVYFQGWLGLGFGRLRDGSFVFRALRVVERLREDGVIKRSLSRQEMLELANHIASHREYTTNFERSDKFFVKDIVDDLRTLGIIESTAVVPPYSALRILESFQENVQDRFFGWRAYYMFNDSHYQSGDRQTTVYSNRPPSRYDETENSWGYTSRLGFQYGKPLSLFTHLYAEGLIDLPSHYHDTRYSMSLSTIISHQVGERLLLTGSYRYSAGFSDAYGYSPSVYRRSFGHTLQGNFVYFLEDQVHLQTSIGYAWQSSTDYEYASGRSPGSSSTSGLSFGITILYNII